MGGLEEHIELEAAVKSKDERRSKSCTGSPVLAHRSGTAGGTYLKSTVKAFMRTELHYKEKSYHHHSDYRPKPEEVDLALRHAISTPNLFVSPLTMRRNINLVTEVHLKRNDFMMKII